MRDSWSPAELNQIEVSEFVRALEGIFENSPWVAMRTAECRPFSGRSALAEELWRTVLGASDSEKLALIRAHPDLAGRMSRASSLTAESKQEQSAAGLDTLTEEETAELATLNSRYNEKFGFPFIICARLTDKAALFPALRRRLELQRHEEISEALEQIRKIADLRLQDLVRED